MQRKILAGKKKGHMVSRDDAEKLLDAIVKRTEVKVRLICSHGFAHDLEIAAGLGARGIRLPGLGIFEATGRLDVDGRRIYKQQRKP